MTQQKQEYRRPLPTPQPESDLYWEKAKKHELWLRRCKSCNATYFYPRDICPGCHEKNVEWIKTNGKGTLYAFSIVHRTSPQFQDMVPYVLAMVEMEGGARVFSNLVQVKPEPANIKIGMPVEAVFDDVTPELTLPKFKPAGA